MTPAKLQPALYGGAFIGVLSALPFVNLGNFCCCMWVIGGGVIAAYVMQQNYPLPITVADGALVGLLAGVFGGVIGAVLSIPIELAFGDMQREMFRRVVEGLGTLPPEAQDVFDQMEGRGAAEMALGTIFQLMIGVVAGAIFGMLGGVLGAAMFRKDQPPTPSETPLVP
ncbi:MAG: hypothetical protein ACRD1S_04240 [Vicinamibacterales bacterium]